MFWKKIWNVLKGVVPAGADEPVSAEKGGETPVSEPGREEDGASALAAAEANAYEPGKEAGGARILAIANQKGGVGKTTTAINLSASICEAGANVLLVDMDPQGNATSGVGIERADLDMCLYDVLVGGEDIKSILRKGPITGLDVIPSTQNLAGAEVELVVEPSRETRLARALEPLRHQYDSIIVDCPPSLSLLTVIALAAADEVLIPIQCEYDDLEGLIFLMRTIQRLKLSLNEHLKVAGIVMTMHDSRTNLSEEVIREVRRQYPQLAYRTVIPRTVRLSEAPSFGEPILTYAANSKGAVAYRELAKEVMQIDQERIRQGAGSTDRLDRCGGGEPPGGAAGRGHQNEPAAATQKV